MKYTYDDLVSFASEHGLHVKLLDNGSYDILVFRDESKGDEYRYSYPVGYLDCEFSKIIDKVTEYFGLVTYETVVELPVADSLEGCLDTRQVNICGLTKHEYMALELTKAWASTRAQGHQNECEIVAQYEYILDEIKRRNL